MYSANCSGSHLKTTKIKDTFPLVTYPASGVNPRDPKAVVLVDMGDNWAQKIAFFHETYPEVSGCLMLHDLPAMVKAVERSFPKDIGPTIYDFFTLQPVEGKQ